jgi:signal transduction histidine kinase
MHSGMLAAPSPRQSICSDMQATSHLPVSQSRTPIKRVPLARVLVVDDDGGQVEIICRLLRAQGYTTIGATSAAAALDALHALRSGAGHFDVLITDLVMPTVNGITLLRAAHEIDSELVGIIMTGRGTIETAIEAMKSGAFDYILKPFNLDIAMSALSRALAARSLRLEKALLLQQKAVHAAELETANRELRAANRELDAFSSSVSHDLRQPISNIIGFADLISREMTGPLNARQRVFFDHIYKGGKRLLLLTEELLRFSHLGHQPLRKESVDMDALVAEVLSPIHMTETRRGVEFSIGALPCALGDRLLLKQVIVNLLSNALKFTKNVAHPIIEVTGKLESGRARYCVRDNGAGFDMANAGRLFSMFHRLHTSLEFEGTGVGLSIVQRIVERHGGAIAVEAAVGKGAAFTFELQIADAE